MSSTNKSLRSEIIGLKEMIATQNKVIRMQREMIDDNKSECLWHRVKSFFKGIFNDA